MRRGAWIVALAVFAAACNGGGGDEGPTSGGVLRVAGRGLGALDPAQAVEPARVAAADLVFDTVVGYSPETGEAQPLLATEWTVSEDQRRFTFTLADDAEFHDGSPVTADDVKASWERVVAPDTGSPVAGLLAAVDGFAQARDGTAGLAGIRARDDRTLVVELTAPQSDFVLNLTHPALGVLPEGRMRPRRKPVGSGPFRVERVEEGILELRAAEGHDVFLDGVELHDVERSRQAIGAIEDGGADAAMLRGTSKAPDDTTIATGDYLAVGYYALNLRNPKFADERVRAAIVLAIDGEAVVEVGYGGSAGTASGIVPMIAAGAGDDVCEGRCGPDRARAEQLLSEVFGQAPPPTIFLDYDDSSLQQRVAEELQRQLGEVGITAELRAHPAEEYDDFLVNGDPEMFRFGWVGEVPAAREFLTPVFVPDAPENVLGVRPPDLVPSLTAAAEATNGEQRAAAYETAQESVLDQWCVIPLAQFTTRYAAAEGVRDLEVTPFGSFDATAVWIEDR